MQTHMVINPYYLLLVAWILQSVILLLFVNHSQTNAEKPEHFPDYFCMKDLII